MVLININERPWFFDVHQENRRLSFSGSVVIMILFCFGSRSFEKCNAVMQPNKILSRFMHSLPHTLWFNFEENFVNLIRSATLWKVQNMLDHVFIALLFDRPDRMIEIDLLYVDLLSFICTFILKQYIYNCARRQKLQNCDFFFFIPLQLFRGTQGTKVDLLTLLLMCK